MFFGGDDALIKKLSMALAVVSFLLFVTLFAFGVVRPKTQLGYKCYSWSYRLSWSPMLDVGPIELREPVWTRSCVISRPLTAPSNSGTAIAN